MTDAWRLPQSLEIGGTAYGIRADYRAVLAVIRVLNDPDLPEYLRWQTALALFYREPIPSAQERTAMEQMAAFIACGEEPADGPRLIDWEQDGSLIAGEINKVAGREIRALDFVHWWTFLGWFHGIGEGPLSTVVAIRDKLRRGCPLLDWERTYYRENRARIDLPKRYSAREREEQARLLALLDGEIDRKGR